MGLRAEKVASGLPSRYSMRVRAVKERSLSWTSKARRVRTKRTDSKMTLQKLSGQQIQTIIETPDAPRQPSSPKERRYLYQVSACEDVAHGREYAPKLHRRDGLAHYPLEAIRSTIPSSSREKGRRYSRMTCIEPATIIPAVLTAYNVPPNQRIRAIHFSPL